MSNNAAGSGKTAGAGAFAPLRHATFAVLWTATVVGNTGSFMRDVASSWLVTDLSPSPAMVALIQTAATLPIFLLAIPAGVLTDILDRRRFLIFAQTWLILVSGTLLMLAWTGALTVEYLAALTFLGGVGTALAMPTWQAIVPELVPHESIRAAVTLNSLGINISRAIGPALGGLLLAGLGAAAAYGADVLSYVFVIAALLWWRRPQPAADALNENFLGAFRAGLRYARTSRDLHRVLLRAAVFFAFASCVWALLPLVARELLHGTAGFYGVLLGAVGAGAIAGAFALPWLRTRFDADQLLLGASLCSAVVLALLAIAPPKPVALLLLLVLGVGWITALTTLNGVAQGVLPNWVRGRGLAVYLTVFNGAMAAGSFGWGLVAQRSSVPMALSIGAAGLAIVGLALYRVRLPKGDADLEPSSHWPQPLLAFPVERDRGPVMVQVEYRVEAERRQDFLQTLERFSEGRRRDGAYLWGAAEDAADPERIVEWFLVESWAEHMRQHRRVSHADADLQHAVAAFHVGPQPPKVQHLLSLRASHASPTAKS
ncbi:MULTISPECIES: MFS transporter [unclassified Lysobacter]|uniref:MFS transporter n=1 Tax=unclassified Lysobacter TaxID=2635362 RepID=UPI0006F6AADD|nr:MULTISPECIES: MFS transporter [unclassified Lysobacter]KQZ57808.1 MFS transporter [Lysobacter sp. Root559]KRA74450.1 MFS transporter [Lysobacter sp. Root667]KRC33960.1 MFS transporter [Lysobacter sp. Root76]KRD69294.1 MFS transporter [Lysobacter sp. Root96]